MPEYYDLTTEVDVPEAMRIVTDAGEIIIPAPTRRQMRTLRDATTPEESDKAILGDTYDAVTAYYDDLPAKRWDEFVDKLQEHFFGAGAGDVPGKSQDSSD